LNSIFVGGCTPRAFLHVVFNNTQEQTASYFFLRGQEKVIKKKAAQRLIGIFNPNSLISKEKQALANSHGAPHFIVLKQTLALILFLFGCSAASNGVDEYQLAIQLYLL